MSFFDIWLQLMTLDDKHTICITDRCREGIWTG